jgi:hypothetical protein
MKKEHILIALLTYSDSVNVSFLWWLDNIRSLNADEKHPRTYEVAGQFMKTMSDVSKDLLGLQKQVKDLKADDAVKIGTQNNVVFNGTTAELFKMLKAGPVEDGKIIEQ